MERFLFLLIVPLAAAITDRRDFRGTERFYRWLNSPYRMPE